MENKFPVPWADSGSRPPWQPGSLGGPKPGRQPAGSAHDLGTAHPAQLRGMARAHLSHPVLRPKSDAHHMYAQEKFVIYTGRIAAYQNNQCLKRVLYYKNNVLLQKTNLDSLDRSTAHHMHNRAKKTAARISPH
jgi:hypothetical protein